MRALLVTNDYPPRHGGIQQFVHNLAVRQPPDSIVVYASTWRDPAPFDAALPYEVIRDPSSMLLPTPAVATRVGRIARDRGCPAVWFGAAAPLGLLAPGLRERAGVVRAVGITHGHEVGWAALPGARAMLRRIARGLDTLTYLGEYTRARLDRVLGGLTTLERLAPGVDPDAYSPAVSGARVRASYGLGDRPVVLCVSRLVPRKGQDMLIRALPAIRARVRDAALLLVGGGPYRSTLERLVREQGLGGHVRLTGAVPHEALPEYYAAGDVFAMPCRTRRGGLDVEGLGMVFLEASASGLPVVAGDSGGAPDAVLDGETGYVVDGRDATAVADRVAGVLEDRALAAKLGAAGRAWVQADWGWDTQARRLRALLS